MGISQRARMAFQAWRDHLITGPEAMEISGAESESDLLALGGAQEGEGREDRPEGQD